MPRQRSLPLLRQINCLPMSPTFCGARLAERRATRLAIQVIESIQILFCARYARQMQRHPSVLRHAQVDSGQHIPGKKVLVTLH